MMTPMMPRRKMLAAGSALAATTLLAACGAADDDFGNNGSGNASDPTATPSPEPQGTLVPDPIPYPTGADDLVLRIEYSGGFVPVEYQLTQLPAASLFGDGRLVVQGPQIEIYPPPALPNLLTTKFNSEGMQTILARAEAAGLFDGDAVYDDLTSVIADAPNTVFITNAGGQSSTVSVYALGIEADPSILPPEDLEIYQGLSAFMEFLMSAPHNLPGSSIDEPERAYDIERLQVISQPLTASERPLQPTEPEPQELDWPLNTPLSEFGDAYSWLGTRCKAVEGGELDTLLDALAGANTQTRWLSDEQPYILFLRPLLPDEEACRPFNAPGANGFEHPTGADEVVLRIQIQGGFVPMEWHATNLPVVSLMGDGSLITQGAQIRIYPPPALPSLVVTKLNDDGIQAILQEAAAAGLMNGDQHYDMFAIADAETTIFTVAANGETHTVSVYALSLTEDMVDIPEEEKEARRRLARFMNLMTGPGGWLPTATIVEPEQQYEFERLQVAAQPESSAAPPDPDLPPGEAEWPLSTPLSELGDPYYLEMSRCFVVEGSDLTTLLPMLAQTNILTRWISDGERYVLYLLPLMPDQAECVDPLA